MNLIRPFGNSRQYVSVVDCERYENKFVLKKNYVFQIDIVRYFKVVGAQIYGLNIELLYVFYIRVRVSQP